MPRLDKSRQRGMSLIEVLIALLILFISLLGSAGMQLSALKHTASALITTPGQFYCLQPAGAGPRADGFIMSSPRSGFGLIELMVALALGMLVVLGMTQLFASSREAYLGQQSSAMLQEDARFVLSKLAREIRMAGMLGCLSADHIVDAPAAFKTPVSWQGGVLRMISSSAGLQSAKPDWTVVSDCTTVARAYPGARLSLAPGETAFPLRELFYRFEQGHS